MSTKIQFEIDEKKVAQLVLAHIEKILNVALDPGDVVIQVKSKQNYRAEWESAAYRAVVNKTID